MNVSGAWVFVTVIGGKICTESVAGRALIVPVAVSRERLAVFEIVLLVVREMLTGIVIGGSGEFGCTVMLCVLQDTIGPLELQIHPSPLAVPGVLINATFRKSVTVNTPVMGFGLMF